MFKEIKKGQRVWVKFVLEEGKMIERKVEEVWEENGQKIIFLSRFVSLRKQYSLSQLILDEKEAIEICREAKKRKLANIEKEYADFNSVYPVSIAPIPRPYASAWEGD